MGVLLHLVKMVGLMKALFIAVQEPLGYTPVSCFDSLGCFSSHSLGEASHLHQLFVVGCEGCNSRSEMLEHGRVVGGGCSKVVEVVTEVLIAGEFFNGVPIWGPGGGEFGLPQRPMDS